mgnify:CR=1 FL=1
MDCGPSCLRMIAAHYGKRYSLEELREKSHFTREGVSLLGISEAAGNLGFRTLGVYVGFEELKSKAPLPCVVYWNQQHFVVVHKIETIKGIDYVHVADPGAGLLKYTKEEFCHSWLSTRKDGADVGIALLLEPMPDFYNQTNVEKKKPADSLSSFLI